MLNYDINFTKEEADKISSFVTFREGLVDNKRKLIGEFTKDFYNASEDDFISTQNKVFNAVAHTEGVDYTNASYEQAMEVINRISPYNEMGDSKRKGILDFEVYDNMVKNKDGKPVSVNHDNYKSVLGKIASDLIRVENGVDFMNAVTFDNGNLVKFNFNGMETPQMEKPEKPNIFKRVLHSLFGAYKQEFDEYESKMTDYRINSTINSNKQLYGKFTDNLENKYSHKDLVINNLETELKSEEEIDFENLMKEVGMKERALEELKMPEKQTEKEKDFGSMQR